MICDSLNRISDALLGRGIPTAFLPNSESEPYVRLFCDHNCAFETVTVYQPSQKGGKALTNGKGSQGGPFPFVNAGENIF